jgi:hypothetical protein
MDVLNGEESLVTSKSVRNIWFCISFHRSKKGNALFIKKYKNLSKKRDFLKEIKKVKRFLLGNIDTNFFT